jgi:hypothetical protein
MSGKSRPSVWLWKFCIGISSGTVSSCPTLTLIGDVAAQIVSLPVSSRT